MRKVRHKDGAVHYSELRAFDLSPAHYLAACQKERGKQSTPPQLLGTCAHAQVLGDRPHEMLVPFDGKTRSGNTYKAFAKEYGRLAKSKKKTLVVVPMSTWEKAKKIAASVKADAVASALIYGEGVETEVPLRWTDPGTGIECATEGIDVLSRKGRYLADLKTVSRSQPSYLIEHAWSSRFHVQTIMYAEGCIASKIPIERAYCIAVETEEPYAVTVLSGSCIPPLIPTPGWAESDVFERARITYRTWLERLKQCEETGEFPPYQLAPVDWTIPDRVLSRMGTFEAEET